MKLYADATVKPMRMNVRLAVRVYRSPRTRPVKKTESAATAATNRGAADPGSTATTPPGAFAVQSHPSQPAKMRQEAVPTTLTRFADATRRPISMNAVPTRLAWTSTIAEPAIRQAPNGVQLRLCFALRATRNAQTPAKRIAVSASKGFQRVLGVVVSTLGFTRGVNLAEPSPSTTKGA